MAKIFQYNKVQTIVKKLDVNSASNFIPLYINSGQQNNLPDTRVISVNAFVKNLKAYSKINSLPKTELPDFQLEDSETQKLNKVLDLEWNSPRKQLSLYIGEGESWEIVGSVSLLSSFGYPFRMYNLMDFFTDNLAIELGINGKLGVRIEDVGSGLLASNDTVTVHGSYVEEVVLEDIANSISSCTNRSWKVNAQSQKILNANPNRKYLCIVNLGSIPIYLSLSGLAELEKGIMLSSNGASYEISNYKGEVSAMSLDITSLSGIECA